MGFVVESPSNPTTSTPDTPRKRQDRTAPTRTLSKSNQLEESDRSASNHLEHFQVKRKRKRKVTRRGRRNKLCKLTTNFILLHSNIRGLKSKVQSLNHIVNNIIPVDCISLNEHGVRGSNKVQIENYYTFSKNRKNKKMGGVSLSIPEDKIDSFMKIKEGEYSDEYFIIRNESFVPPINILWRN